MSAQAILRAASAESRKFSHYLAVGGACRWRLSCDPSEIGSWNYHCKLNLTSRALAPVELAIADWKGFVAARQGAQRLYQLLELLPAEQEPMRLPKPKSVLSVMNAWVLPPGSDRLVVSDISFELKSGQGLRSSALAVQENRRSRALLLACGSPLAVTYPRLDRATL